MHHCNEVLLPKRKIIKKKDYKFRIKFRLSQEDIIYINWFFYKNTWTKIPSETHTRETGPNWIGVKVAVGIVLHFTTLIILDLWN